MKDSFNNKIKTTMSLSALAFVLSIITQQKIVISIALMIWLLAVPLCMVGCIFRDSLEHNISKNIQTRLFRLTVLYSKLLVIMLITFMILTMMKISFKYIEYLQLATVVMTIYCLVLFISVIMQQDILKKQLIVK